MSKYYKIYFTFADFNPILAYLEIYTKNLTQIHSLGRYLLPLLTSGEATNKSTYKKISYS